MNGTKLLSRERYADIPTKRIPAITRPLPLENAVTEPVELLGPDDVTDKRPAIKAPELMFDQDDFARVLVMAREDEVSVRTLLARLVRKAYFARYVERRESHG